MKRIFLFFLSLIVASSFAQTPDALLESVRKKFAAKDFLSAKTEATKILEANPKNKVALDLRGQARAALQDFYGAVSDYTVALDIDSIFADALSHRGEAKTKLGEIGRASCRERV